MAHSTYLQPNGPDNTEPAAKHSSVGYSLETPYGYQIDLDFLKYVDSIERANAIRRLSLQRRFGAANPISEPQGRLGPAQWTSSESLSSGSSDDVLRASFSSSSSSSSSMSHRRPPLPPSHSSPALSGGHEAAQPPVASQRGLEGKPPTAARSPALPRANPHVERTLLETRRRLEQEKASVSLSSSSSPAAPEPHPRRRLASFGGLGSSGSLSPYTSWKALNQSQQAGGAKLSVAEQPGQGMLSLGSTSGGSLRHSPLSSGRATPVTSVSPLHLQLVRDQMMVALQRLKELEEQVKAIPVLQVKISVLQEEKRQLVAQVKNLKGEETDVEASFRKRAHSTGSAEQLEMQRPRLRRGAVPDTSGDNQDSLKSITTSGLKEFKQLTAEMQALEKKIKDARLETRHVGATKAPHARGLRSVAVGDDSPLDEIVILQQSSMKRTRDAATEAKLETRSAAVGVSESMLGASSAELELEVEAQQHTIRVLSDQVHRLEAELKDMALQKEMGRLRHELRNAGARNHKSSTAQPLTHSAGSQTKAQTRSLGVASHPNMQDASTGEQDQAEGEGDAAGRGVAVGVSCRPETRCVAAGHDTPMERWSVREKVETCEKGVGDRVSVRSQSVCTESSVREAGVLTEETMESLSRWARKADQRTVGCGDCTVDVAVTPLRALTSRGTLTEPVKAADVGVMATPCTTSQRTNTSVDSVSRFTSTTEAFVTESSTNTCLNSTKEKHTNTTSNLTRTIAVGEGRVKDTESSVRMRSVGVGTSAPGEMVSLPRVPTVAKVATRETGVGLANVHENFLVGLRTRNIACGPSRLPDPTKTRSIGIGVGEGRLRDASGRWQTLTTHMTQMTQTTQTTQTAPVHPQPSGGLEPGLDHYIERMQRLLKEQQCLLSESHSELGQVMAQPKAHFSSISTQLASTLSCLDSAVRQTGPEEPQPQHRGPDARPACETTHKSPGRKKNPLGEKKSSDLLGPPSEAVSLKPIIKRKDGPQGRGDRRKKLKATGLESMAMSEDSCSEDSDSDGAVEAAATSERRAGNSSSSSRPAAEERKNRGRLERRDRYELSEKTLSACHTLKAHLCDGQTLSSRELRSCLNALQQEWFRVSSQKAAQAGAVGDFLGAAHRVSPLVQGHVANMADGNGNTALHYSVSHSNFSVVKKLLDADVCNVDQQNKAGYTPIMLAALAAVETEGDMGVVEELFCKGDVNAKASQAGQTALMLAVSHGRMDMVRALLTSGSEVNIQDDEGSTALMCASEHGHADIVKLLLSQPGCDATLSDNDESTALSIALEAGHKDIAMLLYAHVNFSKGQAPGTPRLGHRLPPIQ